MMSFSAVKFSFRALILFTAALGILFPFPDTQGQSNKKTEPDIHDPSAIR